MKRTNLFKRMRIRKEGLSQSDKGVATTVGTIMALLVFLSILSLITQQYVPVWMEDKEAYHMDEAMGQFSDLKSTIDNLIMNSYSDYPMYSSFALGSEGIPLFASQTGGIMRLEPTSGGMTFNFTSGSREISFSGGGGLSLDVRNRYFEPQTIVYENGAILLEQNEKAVIRAPAPLRIDREGDNYSVSIVITEIIGDETRIGGTGNVGIISELWNSDKKTYTDSNNNLNNVQLTIDTQYVNAYANWLKNNTDASNINKDVDANQITIDLGNTVSDITVTYSTLQMKIST